MARWLIVMAALFSIAGCDLRNQDNGRPLDRASVKAAFADAGEPLVVRLDMTAADPDSPVDVVFVPLKEDVPEPPFELTLFDDRAAAEEHARLIEEVSGASAEVQQLGNAILMMSPAMREQRRIRLAATFALLDSD